MMSMFPNQRCLALAFGLTAFTTLATSAQEAPSENAPTSGLEIDISGELITTEQALHFVLSEDRVPNASTVKLERVKARFSARGNYWEFLFRDEDKTYEATVGQDRRFELEREFDEDAENAAFWATLPAPYDVELPEAYLERSIEIVDAFNPTFTAAPRAIVEYEVCRPTEEEVESNYANGCRQDEDKEQWEVFVQVSSIIRGEEDTFFKAITFRDGHPITLNRARVSGNW